MFPKHFTGTNTWFQERFVNSFGRSRPVLQELRRVAADAPPAPVAPASAACAPQCAPEIRLEPGLQDPSGRSRDKQTPFAKLPRMPGACRSSGRPGHVPQCRHYSTRLGSGSSADRRAFAVNRAFRLPAVHGGRRRAMAISAEGCARRHPLSPLAKDHANVKESRMIVPLQFTRVRSRKADAARVRAGHSRTT